MLIDNKVESDKLRDMIERDLFQRAAIDYAYTGIASMASPKVDTDFARQTFNKGINLLRSPRRVHTSEVGSEIFHYHLLSMAVKERFPQDCHSERQRTQHFGFRADLENFGVKLETLNLSQQVLLALAEEYLVRGEDPWVSVERRMSGRIQELAQLDLTDIIIRFVQGKPRKEESLHVGHYSPPLIA